MNEIKLMKFMNHENVIQLYEVYESTKYIHLVLPHLTGGELFTQINQKGLYRESDCMPVMKNFLNAIAYLHENLIVHRDLKPENLIFASKDDNLSIIISDFGLAIQLTGHDKKLKMKCGSPGYVAPEVLDNLEYNCKADIFSAGAILFCMLTGR